jgi:protein-disulfide isomerase
MSVLRGILTAAAISAFFVGAPAAQAEGLFKYKGKTYNTGDLPASAQQNLHDLQVEHYLRTEALVQQAALDLWLDELAKEKKKTRAEVEAEVFKVQDPTDKQVEQWYEENKNRLPPGYNLEQIAGDIRNLLAGEERKKVRDKVMDDLKKKGTYTLLLAEPKAPVFKINTDGFFARGSDKAQVTIVEFADYQCPHCKAAKETIGKLLKKFDSKLRLIYIDFPINPSGISLEVAHGAYCAGQQKKYWEYHDLAFERQKTLDQSSTLALAKELKLDEAQFQTCLNSPEAKTFVEKSKAEGDRIGISGTPGIFINGKKVKGYDEKDLTEEVQSMLGGKAG